MEDELPLEHEVVVEWEEGYCYGVGMFYRYA